MGAWGRIGAKVLMGHGWADEGIPAAWWMVAAWWPWAEDSRQQVSVCSHGRCCRLGLGADGKVRGRQVLEGRVLDAGVGSASSTALRGREPSHAQGEG